MASHPAPLIVVKNQDIKDKLSERIYANYNDISFLSKQIIKGSGSSDVLEKSFRHFASHEAIVENSMTNLKKIGLLVSNLQFQAEAAEKSFTMLEDIQDKIKAITRQT